MRQIRKLVSIILCLLIGSIGVLAYATSERKLPIYSVHRQDKVVALTFDCAWGGEDIPEILEILNKHHTKAAFFMVGDWMRKYPEAVRAISEEGHDLGNHSDKHPHVNRLPKEDIMKDMRMAHNTIKEITGRDCWLYRGPYGEYNDIVLDAARECGYYTIQWDVDSLDWKEYGKSALIDKVLKHKNLAPGSIILLHNATKYTKDALEEIIVGLQTKGYRIIPLSEMIMKENYQIDHTGRQYQLP
ncbi:MAG: polysaccharide deacetylase family protein [Cellulosilyticaceae bacterium]